MLAAAFQPYFVWGDAAAAAAAAGGGGAAAAAAASDGGAAAAAAASSSSAPPPPRVPVRCNCKRNWDPVCGTDGRTYSNACVLRCVSDINVNNGWPAIAIRSRGECPRNRCNCPKNHKPVCGSDNNSYANECLFNCENARRKLLGLPQIKILYNGVCKVNVCICSDIIIPVCGTDNRTYRNICLLQCASRNNQLQNKPPIWWQNSGPCKNENCVCPISNEPVCGSDGRTYKNLCALACQNRRLDQLGKPPVKVAYKGTCIKDCVCPTVYDPVCASNGVTFANTCVLACTNKVRSELNLPILKISYWGACSCNCNLMYDPVCASDDRTYANPCKLRCENKRRADLGLRQLKVVHNGRCVCNCSYCPRFYDPVCGTDGRTYWNRCWLVCNRNCNSDIGRPLFVDHNGPC